MCCRRGRIAALSSMCVALSSVATLSYTLQAGQECVCDITCTFLEIYNDELRDLLAAQSSGSKIGIRCGNFVTGPLIQQLLCSKLASDCG